jgi:hypothetical protein
MRQIMSLFTGSHMTAGAVFLVVVSQGPRVLVRCIVVNIRFLLTIWKEDAGNDSVCCIYISHIRNMLFIAL